MLGISAAITEAMTTLTWRPDLTWGQAGLTWGGRAPDSGRKKKMANVNPNQCIGFLDSVADYLEHYKAVLIPKKYDPTDDITGCRAAAMALSKTDGDQEKLKTDLAKKTDEVNGLCDGHYTEASGMLDTAIGKLGKRSLEADEARRLRKTVRGRTPKNNGNTPPPTP